MADDKPQPFPDGFVPLPPPKPGVPSGEGHIILNPQQRPAPSKAAPTSGGPKPKGPTEVKDGAREVVETVVFVVVLVLLLKTFLAEAFVIPTGSMATTLLGYHKNATCEQCGYHFRVNASDEAENGSPTIYGDCPNCRYRHFFPQVAPRGGDKQ